MDAPQWTGPATTLSILFGRQKLGIQYSALGRKKPVHGKTELPLAGPRVGSYLLLSLNEVSLQPDPLDRATGGCRAAESLS